MSDRRKIRPNNVTRGLEAIDPFAATPLMLNARGEDVTDRFPQPEWSAFHTTENDKSSRLPFSYATRFRNAPGRADRDRTRRRHKRAERLRKIAERERAREALFEVRHVFKAARKAEARIMRTIENCLDNGQEVRARKLQRVYLRSFSAKLMALEKANNKLRPRHRRSGEQLIKEARNLNVFSAEIEPVLLRWIVKENSPTRIAYKLRWKDHRLIQSFGLRHKARQYLCKRALEPFLLPSLRSDQTGVQGTTQADAITKIVRAIESGELRQFIELDVENFFPNIGAGSHNRDGDSIYRLEDWLPLPEKVIQTCVLTKHNTVDLSRIPSTDTLSQRLDSQRGVPQGSAVSPLIASYVMAKLLGELEQHLYVGTHLVSHVDNVGIYGSEPKALMHARLALMRECFRSRFGTLRLKDSYRIVSADHGFNFLGYHIRREVTDGAPVAVVSVSEKGLARFRREVRRRLKEAQVSSFCADVSERRENTVSSMKEFIQGWCAGYSCVHCIQEIARREASRAAFGLGRHQLLQDTFKRL